MRTRTYSFVFLALFTATMLTACGGDKGSSSSTTAPTPVATGVTVNGPSTMLNGRAESYTATVGMSNGSSQSASCTWSTDSPNILAIDSSGRATASGTGGAAIICQVSSGARGSKHVDIAPDFQGTWSGSYVIGSCTSSGVFSSLKMCSDFSAGTTLPASLNLVQDVSGSVSGKFYLGSLGGDARGPINGGELVLTGTHYDPTVANIDTIWRLRSERAGQITGQMTMTWNATQLYGSMTIGTTIRSCTRSGGAAAPAMPLGEPRVHTLEEMVRAVIQR